MASHSDVAEAERITLHHLDTAWRDHLAEIAMLRDGIHLVGLGGLNPIDEITSRIDEAIIETFRAVPMGPAGIDLEQEGLRGPASTWTYLVNDDSTADHLANLLTGNRDMGMNVGAGLMWPLLGLWIAARKLTQRRR